MLNYDFIEKNYLNKFKLTLADVEYEKKGIWFSEIFFIFAFCEYFQTELLLESGRARGQSTLCLSKLLPKTEILSIEYIKDGEDSLIAESRLKNQNNVKLVYGDSFEVLKKIKFNTNFFMLIDGPKKKLSINLAKKILLHERCLGVFMHDCNKGSIERSFENEHKGISYFSDDEQFCERFKYLDFNCYNEKRKPYLCSGLTQKSYGPTVGLFLKIRSENKNLLGNLII